ncbi:MAG: hypothetical protein GY861_24055, partial [bacterium]|nr:hypothetical protein [bacterium]
MPIEMPTVSCYLELLDAEELSLCEKPAKIQNRTDKPMKSSAESKVRIEIDSPEQQLEPEYFLEKWPPECCLLPNKFTKHFTPKVNSLTQNAVQPNETTLQKPVMRLNNQVKRLIDQVPIKAF